MFLHIPKEAEESSQLDMQVKFLVIFMKRLVPTFQAIPIIKQNSWFLLISMLIISSLLHQQSNGFIILFGSFLV